MTLPECKFIPGELCINVYRLIMPIIFFGGPLVNVLYWVYGPFLDLLGSFFELLELDRLPMVLSWASS